MDSELWWILKYIPYAAKIPWHFPITCVFCKCKKHIKFIGITKPSKLLHAIWLWSLLVHCAFACMLLTIFIIEINRKETTLSIAQIIFYCFFGGAAVITAAPLYFVCYFVRSGHTPTELMKLDRELLNIKGKDQFRCKYFT